MGDESKSAEDYKITDQMPDDIGKSGTNEPFNDLATASSTRARRHWEETHQIIRVKDGFMLRPVAELIATTQKIWCRVFRNGVDPENRNVPISINVNDPKYKKKFLPGQLVQLTQMHIGVLKNAVKQTRIPIDKGSGIYESRDPIAAARAQYPTMDIEYDTHNDIIFVVDRLPNYVIETFTDKEATAELQKSKYAERHPAPGIL